MSTGARLSICSAQIPALYRCANTLHKTTIYCSTCAYYIFDDLCMMRKTHLKWIWHNVYLKCAPMIYYMLCKNRRPHPSPRSDSNAGASTRFASSTFTKATKHQTTACLAWFWLECCGRCAALGTLTKSVIKRQSSSVVIRLNATPVKPGCPFRLYRPTTSPTKRTQTHEYQSMANRRIRERWWSCVWVYLLCAVVQLKIVN